MSALLGDYYNECHEIFRRSTNQTELMLAEVMTFIPGKQNLAILSVGSGIGLFEVQMIRGIHSAGGQIERFVGIDPNDSACRIFSQKLIAAFGPDFNFEVLNQSFQESYLVGNFDFILYNHAFEYLGEHHDKWIRKSLELLAQQGAVLIFSPQREGINKIYAESAVRASGIRPFFADDLERMLCEKEVSHSSVILHAECDISPLLDTHDSFTKIGLLSFLSQTDCRQLSEEQVEDYVDYYLSIRMPATNLIAHPATLFILENHLEQ